MVSFFVASDWSRVADLASRCRREIWHVATRVRSGDTEFRPSGPDRYRCPQLWCIADRPRCGMLRSATAAESQPRGVSCACVPDWSMHSRVLRLVVREAVTLFASAIGGSLVIFGMLRLLGGDVALIILGYDAAPDSIDALRLQLGLNRPWYVQYIDWISGFFTGNLGRSYSGGYDIFQQIVARMGPTSLLAFSSLFISIVLAIVIGTYSALHAKDKRGTADRRDCPVGYCDSCVLGGAAAGLRLRRPPGLVPCRRLRADFEGPGGLPFTRLSFP